VRRPEILGIQLGIYRRRHTLQAVNCQLSTVNCQLSTVEAEGVKGGKSELFLA
jgi:hypothetical protein